MSETKRMVTALRLLLGDLRPEQVRALLHEAGFVTPVVYTKESWDNTIRSSIETQLRPNQRMPEGMVSAHVLGVIEASVPMQVVKTIEYLDGAKSRRAK